MNIKYYNVLSKTRSTSSTLKNPCVDEAETLEQFLKAIFEVFFFFLWLWIISLIVNFFPEVHFQEPKIWMRRNRMAVLFWESTTKYFNSKFLYFNVAQLNSLWRSRVKTKGTECKKINERNFNSENNKNTFYVNLKTRKMFNYEWILNFNICNLNKKNFFFLLIV